MYGRVKQARVKLSARLQARRSEIEQATLARIYAISIPLEASDRDYLDGLRTALTVALDYGLAVVESGEERAPAIPAALLTQSRVAARSGVGLDTVLRRYFAGYSLLTEFVIQEAEDSGLLGDATLQRVLRGQAAVLDRLIAAVSEEHGRESNGRVSSTEQRRRERVERLLGGEFLDTYDLAYDFDAHHLGVIASCPSAGETLRELAGCVDARLLLVRREEATVWAWLGSRRRMDAARIERLVRPALSPQACFAFGEPANGLAGWRLTHRQAKAAFAIALRRAQSTVRYADVALLASVLQDDLLVTSLHELYLAPLSQARDGGAALRQTLRAYFAADRHVSSTATALGVSRATVANRLRVIEERIGCPLRAVASQVEVALRLQELDDSRAAAGEDPRSG